MFSVGVPEAIGVVNIVICTWVWARGERGAQLDSVGGGAEEGKGKCLHFVVVVVVFLGSFPEFFDLIIHLRFRPLLNASESDFLPNFNLILFAHAAVILALVAL